MKEGAREETGGALSRRSHGTEGRGQSSGQAEG